MKHLGKMIYTVKTKENFLDILKQNKAVVIDVHAVKWCQPCKVIAPYFHNLSIDPRFDKIVFVDIDVDIAADDLISLIEVASVPTFLLVVDGKEVVRFSSADKSKLDDMLTVALKAVAPPLQG
jgi:thiol-disulfide isomerase/thioredoxin